MSRMHLLAACILGFSLCAWAPVIGVLSCSCDHGSGGSMGSHFLRLYMFCLLEPFCDVFVESDFEMTASEARPRKTFFKCASCFSSGTYCTHQKNSKTKTGQSSAPRGGGKKFFKCRECYSSGAYCNHSSGSSSSKKPFVKKAFTAKPAAKPKSKKKLPDAEKASVPVLNDADKEVMDTLPLNGVRVRGVRLTNPWIVDCDAKNFTGTVCWRGVTEYFRYEFDGGGAFLHRRLLFQSRLQWAFQEIREVDSESTGCAWARGPCVGIDDGAMRAELRRLFGAEATV